MAVNDFTGQNIKDSYQRVIQTDGTNTADGTGSLLPISFDGNNVIISGSLVAHSYVVSESITAVSSGSTIFGNSSDDIHQITGSLLVTGSIIQSGPGNLGNVIQSSKFLLPYLGELRGVDSTGTEQVIISNVSNNGIFFGDDDAATIIEGNLISLSSTSTTAIGHISASGNISSSGNLIGTIDGGTF